LALGFGEGLFGSGGSDFTDPFFAEPVTDPDPLTDYPVDPVRCFYVRGSTISGGMPPVTRKSYSFKYSFSSLKS
jgi:hypothetical protein